MKTPLLLLAALAALPLNFAAAAGDTMQSKAEQTIIPKIVLKGATVEEAFKFFTTSTGIKVVYFPPKDGGAKITLSLTNVPASEALKYITSLAGLIFVYGKDAVHVTEPVPENCAVNGRGCPAG